MANRYFYDWESEQVYTLPELRKLYTELKEDNGTESETFHEFLNNCLDKNGSLDEITDNNLSSWKTVNGNYIAYDYKTGEQVNLNDDYVHDNALVCFEIDYAEYDEDLGIDIDNVIVFIPQDE